MFPYLVNNYVFVRWSNWEGLLEGTSPINCNQEKKDSDVTQTCLVWKKMYMLGVVIMVPYVLQCYPILTSCLSHIHGQSYPCVRVYITRHGLWWSAHSYAPETHHFNPPLTCLQCYSTDPSPHLYQIMQSHKLCSNTGTASFEGRGLRGWPLSAMDTVTAIAKWDGLV